MSTGEKTVWSVSQLNLYVKGMFERDERLFRVMVRGELSNFKLHYSGHMYFTLKDAASVVRGVMFKGHAARLRFAPENGQKVVLTGRVSVYERDGQYQLYAEDMQPDGVGALHVAFEQLKARLSAEGLFDALRKKPLPPYPRRIGVVTSPTGAAIRDILNILSRRYQNADVLIYPVLVQGEGAPAQIIEAIRYFDRHNAADVLIVGRGGGSIEELWAFNDEGVARAAAACRIPIISAVGHETDFTVLDFVADLRAPTPSAAAELAVPSRQALYQQIESYAMRLRTAQAGFVRQKQHRLARVQAGRVFQNPYTLLDGSRQYTDQAVRRMVAAAEKLLAVRRQRFVAAVSSLEALSPLAVLGRGYALVENAQGGLLRQAGDARQGQDIRVRMHDGALSCRVLEIRRQQADGRKDDI